MLRQRWKILAFGLIMQYVHGIFTQLAHRMHVPSEEPLNDIGFMLTPVRRTPVIGSCFHGSWAGHAIDSSFIYPPLRTKLVLELSLLLVFCQPLWLLNVCNNWIYRPSPSK